MRSGNPNPKNQFKVGNKGSPGRPTKATEQAYLDEFVKAFPPAKMARDVVRPLREASRKGDVNAARILIEQAIGKPTQRITVTTPQDDALYNLQKALMADGFAFEPQALVAKLQEEMHADSEPTEQVVDDLAESPGLSG